MPQRRDQTNIVFFRPIQLFAYATPPDAALLQKGFVTLDKFSLNLYFDRKLVPLGYFQKTDRVDKICQFLLNPFNMTLF